MRLREIEAVPTWNDLSDSLERAEATAVSAVVPGELQRWSADLRDALEPVRGRFEAFRAEEQERLDEMLREDPALAHRVETLRADLGTLHAELQAVATDASRLHRRECAAGDASDEPTERGEELRERTLSWLTRVRAYHGRSDSWFVESIYRDRGVKD